MQTAYVEYDKYMQDYRKGVLESKLGMSVKETLESLLNSTLSKVR